MFQQLDLKYFRQHEEKTIYFQPGVVALRGRNEAGKTTILEAMAYAMFGATALREALEDVVTWGHKVSELKVKLDFHLNGVDYRISRSKSGAEIRNSERILATGQKEVTKYVETLLGASQEVCTKLMLASQEDIKGALAKGPSAAIELIEALSNLGVIDTIIGLVQDTLPGGNTNAVQARIATLEEQLEVKVEDKTGPLRDRVNDLQLVLDEKEAEYSHRNDDYVGMADDAAAAQEVVDTYEKLVADAQRAEQSSQRAEVALANHTVPPLPSDAEIANLRQQVSDANYYERAVRAEQLITNLEEADNEWEGDYDSLLREIEDTQLKLSSYNLEISTFRQDITRLEAQKITQTACGLCGKNLSNVPEVVKKNMELDRQIEKKENELEEVQSRHQLSTTYFNALQRLQGFHNTYMATFQRCAEFVKLDHGYCPPRFEWTGPDDLTNIPASPIDTLRKLEADVAAHHAAEGRRGQLETDAKRLFGEWQAAIKARDEAKERLPAAQTVLEQAAETLRRLSAADEARRQAQEQVQAARQALDLELAVVRAQETARKRLEADLTAAKGELAEMEDNNALIRFLREARPLITDQLWGMVLTTVSSYFSDIRGTLSVVTREDNGFKVDGHNVAGLSGSTKDALGLAIRKALTKTFLPNASFMVLDEPAAACDDERESNMLGLIAAGGFEQVLLVTHSDLADSFATQVVQL